MQRLLFLVISCLTECSNERLLATHFGGWHVDELDVARFDWLYLCFGNIPADHGTTELLNRLLAINPDLKIVIRLWPKLGAG